MPSEKTRQEVPLASETQMTKVKVFSDVGMNSSIIPYPAYYAESRVRQNSQGQVPRLLEIGWDAG